MYYTKRMHNSKYAKKQSEGAASVWSQKTKFVGLCNIIFSTNI